jgi:uncharacterized protein (TIGR02246 family)
MPTRHSAVLPLCVSLLLGAMTSPAAAQSSDDARQAARAALQQWATAFNAADQTHVCDLFSRSLRYDYRGLAPRGYPEICDGLHHTLADKTRRFHYAGEIGEIEVSGDMTVVHVVWTLTITPQAAPSEATTIKETSLDVIRREPDGQWRLVRFLAYENP